jgi:hypothetical protein
MAQNGSKMAGNGPKMAGNGPIPGKKSLFFRFQMHSVSFFSFYIPFFPIFIFEKAHCEITNFL